jgi:PAS domain S-box-containing protein
MNIRHFGFLLILVLTMILCPDAEANNHRSILVLHSYHRGFAWDDSIDKGIANIFATHPDVAIRTEYMDTKRINDEEYYSILLKTFKHKFAGLHFDVVISIDNNALNFLTKHRDELFPDTPVAFCGVNNFDPAMLAGTQGFTGATESIAVQETLEAALRLDSDVKHVYIFGANTSTYHGNKAMFLQAIPKFEGRLEFIFNDEVKIPQAIEILKEAPSNSIAIVIAFLRDRNGEFVTFEEACDTISKKTNIPLYGLWDYLLGNGVVGGLVISGLSQGETAAQIALDIMNGKPFDEIPFLLTSPNRYMFDYQQLSRFGFDLDRLPDKSTVINLPNSFYSNYKELIWVVISCAIGLLTIIIILILNILSRKRAEAQYRTTLESMNDIIHVVDSDFNLVLVNQAFKQQANSLGIEGNVTGRNLFELFPFLSGKIHKEYEQIIDNGKLVASEEMVTIQGEDRCAETRKIPILSSNRVHQIVTVIHDITNRKNTEEQIKASLKEKETLLQEIQLSEKRFKEIADLLPVGVVEMDADLKLTYINGAGFRIFEYTKQDLQKGLNGIDLLHPDDREKAVLRLSDYNAGKYLPPTEYQILKKDGTGVPVLFKAIPINKEDEVIGYRASITDISRLKQAETLLRESEYFFSQMFEQSTTSTCLYDPDGTICRVNPAFCEMFGVEEKIITNGSYNVFKDQSAMNAGIIPLLRAVFDERKTNRWEFLFDVEVASNSTETPTIKSGKIHLEVFGYPLLENNGDLKYVVFQHYDITERKQAEKQIKASLREKETLLQEIHHRVKNNMNVVSSLLKLHGNSAKNEEVKNALQESQGRVYAMSSVHEALHNSQNMAEIDLLSYLDKLSTSLLQTYSVNHGQIEMKIDGDEVKVNIDKASPLGLTINELISNALKYAFPDDRKGNIEVTTTKQGDQLELTIKDDGIGMPDDFDWKNTKSLGLKLVRTLVENQLDGSIEVESKNGTKFTIKFNIET